MIGVGTLTISDTAKKYVNQVLDANRLSYGPFTRKFENLFAAHHGCRYAVMSNSGTSALLVALAALKRKYDWQDGDEIIVPALTFIATSNVVLQLNLRPVFVDVDPVYYGINPDLIESKITARTKCIIAVHLFGHPCDMDPIMKIASRHKLRIIEDSCETMFTRYNGRSVGSFGDIGCFSTYVAHILTTGVGGLCTTNDPGLAVDIRSIINHGRDAIYISIDDDKDKAAEEFEMIVKRRFSFVQMGYSFRVTELEGALGLAELEYAGEMMRARRSNGSFFSAQFAQYAARIQVPTIRPGSEHAFMMLPLVMKNEPKDEIVLYLENKGIETRDMVPLTNQPYYKETLGIKEEDYPVAHWINRSGFYIASHQGLTSRDRQYITDAFSAFFSKRQYHPQKSCLIILSRLRVFPEKISLDNYSARFDLTLFAERVLIETAGNTQVQDYFTQKGFTVYADNTNLLTAIQTVVSPSRCENFITISLDGDSEPEVLGNIIRELNTGHNLVIGSRFLSEGMKTAKRSFSRRAAGNRLFNMLIGIFTEKNITDANSMLRGFKDSAVQNPLLNRYSSIYNYVMTYTALKSNSGIIEIPVKESESSFSFLHHNRISSAFRMMVFLLSRILCGVFCSDGYKKTIEQNSFRTE